LPADLNALPAALLPVLMSAAPQERLDGLQALCSEIESLLAAPRSVSPAAAAVAAVASPATMAAVPEAGGAFAMPNHLTHQDNTQQSLQQQALLEHLQQQQQQQHVLLQQHLYQQQHQQMLLLPHQQQQQQLSSPPLQWQQAVPPVEMVGLSVGGCDAVGRQGVLLPPPMQQRRQQQPQPMQQQKQQQPQRITSSKGKIPGALTVCMSGIVTAQQAAFMPQSPAAVSNVLACTVCLVASCCC
jgi:hypothetical protein